MHSMERRNYETSCSDLGNCRLGFVASAKADQGLGKIVEFDQLNRKDGAA